MAPRKSDNPKSQYQRFVEAASEFRTDESEKAFKDTLRKVAKPSSKNGKPIKNTGK